MSRCQSRELPTHIAQNYAKIIYLSRNYDKTAYGDDHPNKNHPVFQLCSKAKKGNWPPPQFELVTEKIVDTIRNKHGKSNTMLYTYKVTVWPGVGQVNIVWWKLNLLHLHSHRVAGGGAGKYRLVGKLNDTLKFKVTIWPEVGQVHCIVLTSHRNI